MLERMLRAFVPNYTQTGDPAVRERYGVLAGAVGNLIDRALLGYVTDMFETLFMRFAVFNVADICVVVGGIAFCVYYLFFHGKEEGHGADSVAG